MDLNAPLGMSPPPPEPPRQGRRVPKTVALALGVIAAIGVLAVAGLYLVNADPHGGEPYGVAAIPPAARKPARPAAPDPSLTANLPPATRTAPAGGPSAIDVVRAPAERQQRGARTPSAAVAQ